jgi:hypothetical protein
MAVDAMTPTAAVPAAPAEAGGAADSMTTQAPGQAAGSSPAGSSISDLAATSQSQLQDMSAVAAIQMEFAMKQNLIQAIEKMVTNTASFIKNSTQDATK